VAGREKNSSPGADVWLIEGAIDRQSFEGDENSNRWLAVGGLPEKLEVTPDGDANEEETGTGHQGEKLRADTDDPSGQVPELQAKLRESTRRIEELESELAETKRQLADANKRSPTKSTGGPERKSAAPAKSARRPRRKSAAKLKEEKVDLNTATFEDLRGLGLAITQSARLIAYRDVRGGFESLSELEEISGLSKRTLAELRGRLRLAT
jgi:DNA uptake protein ComE-like DNA-binding protein